MRIGQTKICILGTIKALCEKNQKTYCWPTRAKMIELLKTHYKIEIALPTLDDHLSDLRDLKYIKSFRRTGRKPTGEIFNLPSNRQLTRKGVFFLVHLGFKVAKWFLEWGKTSICPGFSKKGSATTKPQSSYVPVELREEQVAVKRNKKKNHSGFGDIMNRIAKQRAEEFTF